MKLFSSNSAAAEAVLYLKVHIPYQMLMATFTRLAVPALKGMTNLLELDLTLQFDQEDVVSAIFADTTFPYLQQLIFCGDLTEDIQNFVVRHSSTLRALQMYSSPHHYQPTISTTGPNFAVLQRATVPIDFLIVLLRCGLPATRTFGLLQSPGSIDEVDALSTLSSRFGKGQSTEVLLVEASDWGDSLFEPISRLFPNLHTLSLMPMEHVQPIADVAHLSEVFNLSEICLSCARMTHLVYFEWLGSGFHDSYERGWEVLLQLLQGNRHLENVILPDSGLWRRIGSDVWIPLILNPHTKDLERYGYRWIVQSIMDRTYTFLPSFLRLTETELCARYSDALPSIQDELDFIRSFGLETEIPEENVAQLLVMAFSMGVY
ncbi:hypothetical protein VNI00_000711 [Paramarasmius palmivorus]|uniref:Uncharacterized protein n=1 Tax=Paramarasmius palmivorus TaxID=297713 RepID=A0AAW0E645_9AGAR